MPGVSLKKQDRWLQEAARVAWATPRVRTLSQFRLTDGPKLPGGGFDAWREFQTGLMFHDMRPKPSYCLVPRPVRREAAEQEQAAPLGPGPPRRPARRHRSSARRAAAGSASRPSRTTRRGYWQRKLRSRGGTFRYRWGSGKRRISDHIRVR